MNQSQLLEMFRGMASEVAERDMASISGESVITDLGFDSLQTMELIHMMESSLKISIPDDQLVGIQTVNNLIDLAARRLPKSVN